MPCPQVLSGTHRRTGQIYAIKVMNKAHLWKNNKVKYAMVEKDALLRLSAVNHPGIVRIYWTFADASDLCKH